MSSNRSNGTVRKFLIEDSGFMLVGACIALIWANAEAFVTHTDTYNNMVEFELKELFDNGDVGHDHMEVIEENEDHAEHEEHAEHGHALTIKFAVGAFLMAFFFAIAGKEVWESLLPGGDLHDPRKAATPIIATLGGVVGPAGTYLLLTVVFGVFSSYWRGWAIPCATDIAFSYLIARKIFGRVHPAITFLLLLAILDDAIGLGILAIAYPAGDLHMEWLLLSLLAAVVAYMLNRGFHGHGVHSHWVYLPLMFVSWYGFYRSGFEPALGFIPIIPCMPHAATDLGLFVSAESRRHDTLNEFEHFWKPYVEGFLGLFALVNAGVAFSSVGVGTVMVLLGLVVGKTAFITLFTWVAVMCGLKLPRGMTFHHVVTVGIVASIGFTVALFVSTKAFDAGPLQDQVKMGALLSFFAGGLAIAYARLVGIRPIEEAEESSLMTS